MELGTAIAHTLNLLNEHNLLQQGWTARPTHGCRRVGVCYWNKKVIKLARHHVENATDAEIMDTIRHEVAHALAGQRAKHGPEWRRWARKLGATPRASSKMSYDTPYRYVLFCPFCNKNIQRRRNKVSDRRLANLMHTPCGYVTLGKLLLRPYIDASKSLLQHP